MNRLGQLKLRDAADGLHCRPTTEDECWKDFSDCDPEFGLEPTALSETPQQQQISRHALD